MRLIWRMWLSQFKRRGVQYVLLVLLSFIVTTSVFVPAIVEHQVLNRWTQSAQLVDVVIGRKGSPLQIVASSLYRMENPTGNLSKESAEYWRKHPMVSRSCGISLGDNVEGYPIVGVDSNYFDWMNITLLEGHFPYSANQVVLPQSIAELMGWKVGNELHSAHGSDARGEAHDHHGLEIVGIVQCERAADQSSLFVLNAAYSAMHHGAEEGSVTAMLLDLKSKSALVMLPRVIDAREDEQGAFPVFIFAQLQKQWHPTFEKIQTYGVAIPTIIGFMFLAFAAYLGKSQQSAAQYLENQKIDSLRAHIALYGLYLFAGLFGWCSALVVVSRFVSSLQVSLVALGLIPLIVSQLIHIIQQRK